MELVSRNWILGHSRALRMRLVISLLLFSIIGQSDLWPAPASAHQILASTKRIAAPLISCPTKSCPRRPFVFVPESQKTFFTYRPSPMCNILMTVPLYPFKFLCVRITAGLHNHLPLSPLIGVIILLRVFFFKRVWVKQVFLLIVHILLAYVTMGLDKCSVQVVLCFPSH